MCHSAYDANASSCTCQAKASPSGRWRFVPPKGLSTYLNKESNYIKAATKYTKDLNKFEELKHLLKKFGIKEVASFNSLELIKLGFKDLSFDLIEPYIANTTRIIP